MWKHQLVNHRITWRAKHSLLWQTRPRLLSSIWDNISATTVSEEDFQIRLLFPLLSVITKDPLHVENMKNSTKHFYERNSSFFIVILVVDRSWTSLISILHCSSCMHWSPKRDFAADIFLQKDFSAIESLSWFATMQQLRSKTCGKCDLTKSEITIHIVARSHKAMHQRPLLPSHTKHCGK